MRSGSGKSFRFKAIAWRETWRRRLHQVFADVVDDLAETPARLFGKHVRLPNGPFVLAQVAQVPIYPLFIARSGYRSYQIIVREPITVLHPERDREHAIGEAIEKWARVLEQLITERWDQWFAFAPGFLSDEQNR